MRTLIAVLSGICFLVATPATHAWNEPGHMTAAAIAYADLKDRNPEALTKAIEILKKHPEFNSRWAPKLKQVSEGDRDSYLFMLAARWPDDVRPHPPYHHGNWHYVDILYRPGNTNAEIPQVESILTAYPENRSAAGSSTAADKDRAVAVCWIFHLIGDVHQPLHTTSLITDQFPGPEGDKGGNKFFIRVPPDDRGTKLHSFWDGLILDSDELDSVRNKATELRNGAGLKRDDLAPELVVKPFNDWAKAAHNISIESAYLNGDLKGGTNKENAVVAPHDYEAKARAVAERQIVLSGYRISDVMVDVFGK